MVLDILCPTDFPERDILKVQPVVTGQCLGWKDPSLVVNPHQRVCSLEHSPSCEAFVACVSGQVGTEPERVPPWGRLLRAVPRVRGQRCLQRGPFLSPQLRQLVSVCINPDPEKRPDVTYVYDVAKRVHASTTSA